MQKSFVLDLLYKKLLLRKTFWKEKLYKTENWVWFTIATNHHNSHSFFMPIQTFNPLCSFEGLLCHTHTRNKCKGAALGKTFLSNSTTHTNPTRHPPTQTFRTLLRHIYPRMLVQVYNHKHKYKNKHTFFSVIIWFKVQTNYVAVGTVRICGLLFVWRWVITSYCAVQGKALLFSVCADSLIQMVDWLSFLFCTVCTQNMKGHNK